jgi:hypothetical protein
MKKFKVFADFKEEEAYLIGMAKKGYFMKKYSAFGYYHFTEGEPKDLHYHSDYRSFKTKADFEDYKSLFEDAGWQHVYGTRWSMNQYFLPKDGNTDDDIFSTRESAALRYKHLYEMCCINVAVALCCFVSSLISSNFKMVNNIFLTPGLWEMTGLKFWGAFFLELPFVLLRTVPIPLFLAIGIAYGVWGSRAKRSYDKVMDNIADN